jgi:CspA family cold shock protein
MQSTGTCKWFSRKLGYGFITPDSGGDDVFVHQSEIQMDEFRYLQKAEFVVWIVAKDDKGRSIAKRVQRLGKSDAGTDSETHNPVQCESADGYNPYSTMMETRIGTANHSASMGTERVD